MQDCLEIRVGSLQNFFHIYLDFYHKLLAIITNRKLGRYGLLTRITYEL